VESAVGNGVDLRCEFEVVKGSYSDSGHYWQLQAADGREIKARYVVNAAGLHADTVSRACGAEEFTITPRKGEEYLLDRTSAGRPSRVIFPVPSKHSKGILVIPTAGGTTMIGPTADMVENKDDTATTSDNQKRIMSLVRNMINGISDRDCITAFAGLRPVLEGNEDFYIAPSKLVPDFIQVAGIQSPGLTASPAIGEYVKDLLKNNGLTLSEKSNIQYFLPARRAVRELAPEELEKLHQEDPAWTRIVCRCEKISEAEIVAAVRRGHRTVDGVKFYTRAGMGRCQSGFCGVKIMEIISRESGIPMTELTKRGSDSRMIAGKLGELEVK
jgi:glycerol-3-phosphate dehydrogenase